jgi:anti-sigma-K factor RskA
MSDQVHITEYLPAYALGCLEQEEVAQVSQHLASCAMCRSQLEKFQDVADQLACAAPDAQPSEGLKQQLRARVQPSPIKASKALWGHQLIRLMPSTALAWRAAAAVLIVALVVSNLWLWAQVNRSRPMRTIAIHGTQARPDAMGTVVISDDGDHGALVVDGLEPLDQGLQYQVWLIENGQRTSGGVFSVDDEGYGVIWLSSPKPLADYDAVGITIEPSGGSPAPTGVTVLGGNL